MARKTKRPRKPAAKPASSAEHWAKYAERYKEFGGSCGDEIATRLKQSSGSPKPTTSGSRVMSSCARSILARSECRSVIG
jgi:hypothetical protein